MKIIDLLNKIAKGEEVPKKIDYNGEIFIYNEYLKRYVNEHNKDSDSSTYCLGGFFALDMALNNEIKVVEIIEEEKEIEKLPKHITDNACASKDFREIANKINELIDVINDMRDKE